MKNKKGISTVFILVGILIMFGILLFLIVIGSFATHMNEALDINVSIGQVNLAEVNAGTIGQFNTMIVNNADWWGVATIFGMIIGLFLSAYFARNTFPKIGVIIDIFFIIVAFIFSLYLSATYNSLVNALTSAGETFAAENLPNTSYFVLNLPIFVAVIGVIMMILFHSGIPRKSEEQNIITKIAP